MPFFMPTYKSFVLNTVHENYAKAIFIDEIFTLPFSHKNNAIYIFNGKKTRRGNYSLKIFNYKTKKYFSTHKSKTEVEEFLEKNKISVDENYKILNSVTEFNEREKNHKINFVLQFLFDLDRKLFFDENGQLREDEDLKVSCDCCSNDYLKYLKSIGCMNYKVMVSEHNYRLVFGK